MPRFLALLIATALLAAACTGADYTTPEVAAPSESPSSVLLSDDPIERGCALDPTILERIAKGYDPARSEDVMMVPLFPNYSGTFSIPNHSGPWDYLQNVPFVWYGPGHIANRGTLGSPASVTDIYSTFGRLARVDLPERKGQVRTEALVESETPPRLMLLVVWDGVGRNVLERWPDAWPNLARLEAEGTSYLNGVVGSSPSITPATHANMGTGVYPAQHRVTGIKYRSGTGSVEKAFSGRTPKILKKTTFGDDIDRALGNAPKVGMIAWRSWHLGMLSHGLQLEGGDRDLFGLIGEGNDITGNDDIYYTPEYLLEFPGLKRAINDLDKADGEVDGNWMGHSIRDLHDNPAWIRFLEEALMTTFEREGFGADEVPDVFSTNFKMTDIVGHQYGMDSEEMGVVLAAQDTALGNIIEYLDSEVEDYVVVVTADHGHTPDPRSNGAWPIGNGELTKDLESHFGDTNGTLVDDRSAVGIFLNKKAKKKLGVTEEDVARFLNNYTIADNWPKPNLPKGYGGRGDERVLAAAFPGKDIGEITACAG